MQKQYGWNIKNKVCILNAGIISISFLISYLLVVIIAAPLFTPWQNKITDSFFRLRHAVKGRGEVSPYIIHAVLNDTTYRVLENDWQEADFYSRILSILGETGAKGVACDIFFSKESRYAQDIHETKTALKTENIYFPVILYPASYPTGFQSKDLDPGNNTIVEQNIWYPKILKNGRPPRARLILAPFIKLAEQAQGLGHITCEPDSDGINRRFPLLYKYKDGYFPSLVLRMLCDIYKVDPSDIEVFFGNYLKLPHCQYSEFIEKDISIPIDEAGMMIINYAGSWDDSFIHFPIHNLLKVETDDELKLRLYDDFEGSIVILSDTSTRNKDHGPGIFDKVYPLSGLHLNIANTILTENFLSPSNPVLAFIISVCIAVLLWVLSFLLKPTQFFLSSFLFLCFVILFFAWLFIGLGIIPEVISNMLGIGFSIIFISFYKFLIEEKENKVLKAEAVVAVKLKKVNDELTKSNKTLKQIEEYKEHFVQNITHEFKTPLTLILTPLENLLENSNIIIKPEVQKVLTIIRESSRKLYYLIDQLLDLSKIKSGNMILSLQKCDIASILLSLIHFFLPLAESRGMTIKYRSIPDSLILLLDQEKIEKVISNLISNAIKYSEYGDTITITCKETISAENEKVCSISIEDTGIGISKENIPFIFDRFMQVSAPYELKDTGTGIGLALVKEYVSLHNGKIAVKSESGKGTVFNVYLPMELNKLPGHMIMEKDSNTVSGELTTRFKHYTGMIVTQFSAQSDKNDQEIKTGQEKKKILIIEHDDQMRIYLRFILENTYFIYEAMNSREGLEKAVETMPDLILVDSLIPPGNLTDFLQNFRERDNTSEILVLVMTTEETGNCVVNEKKLMPVDYITKPFTPEELKMRITRYLTPHLVNKTNVNHENKNNSQHQAALKVSIVYPTQPVLLVDDEKPVIEACCNSLAQNGITNTLLCDDSRKVMSLLLHIRVSCVLLDLSMPHIPGIRLLEQVKQHYPEIPVIIITGINSLETAVHCIRKGAYDYLVKPVEKGRLTSIVRHCIEQRLLTEENKLLSSKITMNTLEFPDAFKNIITQNDSMFNLFKLVESFGPTNQPVLITGESGVGKELIAEAIHLISKRKGKFVRENIAGLDATVFSDTLFGHVKGAYTGAIDTRKGLVEQASGGTLFLDEIGELDMESQVKLLRFLEYSEYRPLGCDRLRLSDARIITATNTDIAKKIKSGDFRKDLYFRLSQRIFIPPLRKRMDDITLLLDYFLEESVKAYKKKKPGIQQNVVTLLQHYHYPGNIREFAAMIDRAVCFSKTHSLNISFLQDYIREHSEKQFITVEDPAHPAKLITYSGEFPGLAEVEYFLIKEAMKKAKGNQRTAALLLGLSTSALNRRLKKIREK